MSVRHDWTTNDKGRANSSPLFLHLIDEVARLLRNDAITLSRGNQEKTARLILAQLAHVHGLLPDPRRERDAGAEG